MPGDSVGKTLGVAALLCIVCSILVSGAAVVLRPLQEKNKEMDIKKNLLISAGLVGTSASANEVDRMYERVETKIVDLSSGEYVDDMDIDSYDQKAAAKDPSMSIMISPKNDIAKIKRREKFSKVFLIKDGEEISMIVLPVYGKGLWSTLYGFISIATDLNTIKGFGFYDHAETPGLGGEIDNPKWKSIWIGKKLFDENWKTAITVIKGAVNPNGKMVQHQIDGISGATLTSVGVSYLVQYWVGEDGFYKYLANMRAQMGESSDE